MLIKVNLFTFFGFGFAALLLYMRRNKVDLYASATKRIRNYVCISIQRYCVRIYAQMENCDEFIRFLEGFWWRSFRYQRKSAAKSENRGNYRETKLVSSTHAQQDAELAPFFLTLKAARCWKI